MHPVIKLTFAGKDKFFGPGTVDLLSEIDRCGNVREACRNCGFSYSKGWTILRKCEEKLGYAFVERQAGGQSGGTARVTDKGRELMALYEELEEYLYKAGEDKYRELMSKYKLIGDTEI